MYSVYQHWDPLKVCIVGRSYPPEFYSFVKNDRARTVIERIAKETEEDYQKLISLLESFGVKVLRPQVHADYKLYLQPNGKIQVPPMNPRDYSIMLGTEFYFFAEDRLVSLQNKWQSVRGSDWPELPPTSESEYLSLPAQVLAELASMDITLSNSRHKDILGTWDNALDFISNTNNIRYSTVKGLTIDELNAAEVTRVGRDLYVGTHSPGKIKSSTIAALNSRHPEFRIHSVDTGGHADSTFCPVAPGLIVSLYDVPTYEDTFPGWEVIYLPAQSWAAVAPFLKLKEKNKGKWWVPGEELNDDFTAFVDEWLGHWVGFVEETVFDVNMLVIDEKNVVCNNYNKEVFDAFARRGITPHIINFRHRYFWDGGLHCITSDVHREGTMHDYFPERGQ